MAESAQRNVTKSPLGVSIVIPVYNDANGARTTLESLVAQDHDSYEIVPVDNGSEDNTFDVLLEFEDEYPSLVHPLEEQEIQGSYAARNKGVKYATGSLILFLDADMWVPETWVCQFEEFVEANDCDYAGCSVEVVADGRSPSFWESYEKSLSFPVKTYLDEKHFAPTCALAVRRSVFDDVGTFDSRLESGGDKEFGQRVHGSRFTQCYAENISAYHPARGSWRELKSKAVRIGRGRAQKSRYATELSTDPDIFHPFNFLPPSPFRLQRRFSNAEVSTLEILGFYLLEYILKLLQAYGAISEYFRPRGSDGNLGQ